MRLLDESLTHQVCGGNLVEDMQEGAKKIAPYGAAVGGLAGFRNYVYVAATYASSMGGRYVVDEGQGSLLGLAATTGGYAIVGFWAAALLGAAFGALYSESI